MGSIELMVSFLLVSGLLVAELVLIIISSISSSSFVNAMCWLSFLLCVVFFLLNPFAAFFYLSLFPSNGDFLCQESKWGRPI